MKFLEDVLAGRVALPMVPRVILQLLQALRRDDASVPDLTRLIERDPVLGARILRMANSSYFGGQRSVDSLQAAIGLIGTRPLGTMLVACGAQACFADVPGVNLARFWQLAQRTALGSRLLARRRGLDADAAYSAGLLVGVGHLILCQSDPARAREAFAGLHQRWGAPLALHEQASFGASHPQLSAIWVDRLWLPRHVVEAIDQYLRPPTADATPLARVLLIASQLATQRPEDGAARHALAQAFAQELLDAAGLSDYLSAGQIQQDLQQMDAAGVAA